MDSEKHVNVLLIEDDADDAYLINSFFNKDQNLHIDVERADRLSSALESMEDGKYDVILSDLGLPDSQGLETFLKVHSACPDVPIIVLTGLDDEAGALEAVHRGAQDYLDKSRINGSSLVRVIRHSIERHHLLAELEKSVKEIKTLRSLLPMCAWCKKIRDEKGYWNKVETYITKLTGAEFTHGICPACYEKVREQFPDSFIEEETTTGEEEETTTDKER